MQNADMVTFASILSNKKNKAIKKDTTNYLTLHPVDTAVKRSTRTIPAGFRSRPL